MAENGDAACFYPQEALDLNLNNTSKERIQKVYKVWSVCYDKWVFEGSAPGSPGYLAHSSCGEGFFNAAKDLYGESKKDLKILDLGCGTGLSGQVLKEKYGYDNLVGLDVSEDMLTIARQRNIYKTLISAFVTTEKIEEIQDGEYDAVISAGVITTGLVRSSAFDEIIRWIKPGGIMCFTCPVFDREEDGYKAKCESLKEEGKWTLHTNKEADYYGDKPPRGRGYKTCRLLVYKKV
ncbi:Methyltransferase domain [Porites harrisoni]